MKSNILHLIGLFLILMAGNVQAQDLNPANPPEPFTYHRVTVSATPYGYTSGAGRYLQDQQVTISTSAYSGYTFSHWTRNGVMYSTERNFTYTVDGEKADFVAHYDFTPTDPQEPQGVYRHRLYLMNNIQEACSFNMSSGQKVDEDTYIRVQAYSNVGYDFLGWYMGNVKVSEAESFNYLMGAENVTLEARYKYNPTNPDEPMGGAQDDVANGVKGDVNGDGIVNVSDAIQIINAISSSKIDLLDKNVADMNSDGVVNVSDAIQIINVIIK